MRVQKWAAREEKISWYPLKKCFNVVNGRKYRADSSRVGYFSQRVFYNWLGWKKQDKAWHANLGTCYGRGIDCKILWLIIWLNLFASTTLLSINRFTVFTIYRGLNVAMITIGGPGGSPLPSSRDLFMLSFATRCPLHSFPDIFQRRYHFWVVKTVAVPPSGPEPLHGLGLGLVKGFNPAGIAQSLRPILSFSL